MKRNHFKVTLLPAAIIDVRCVDADYVGPDADLPREVKLDPDVLATHTAYEFDSPYRNLPISWKK